MSSIGRMRAMTPLLPWRPAILSPWAILRFWATYTRTSSLTPAGSSWPLSRLKTLTSTTVPRSPWGTRSDEVADLARLLTEDGAQQALLGAQLRLTLGGDLADEDVAGVHLGADVDDAALVEVAQRLLGDVGEVAGDLLGAELGVARLDLELLDVDRGVHVLAHHLLADQDGVLEVVALPRHERHQHVAAEGELTRCRWTARRRAGRRCRRARRP